MANALLIHNEYCFGCHSCEVACKKEHDLPLGRWGIKVEGVEPFKMEDGKFDYTYHPILTSLCDLCEDRVAEGRKPACVQHCLALCIEYGTVEELAKRASELGSKASILLP